MSSSWRESRLSISRMSSACTLSEPTRRPQFGHGWEASRAVTSVSPQRWAESLLSGGWGLRRFGDHRSITHTPTHQSPPGVLLQLGCRTTPDYGGSPITSTRPPTPRSIPKNPLSLAPITKASKRIHLVRPVAMCRNPHVLSARVTYDQALVVIGYVLYPDLDIIVITVYVSGYISDK